MVLAVAFSHDGRYVATGSVDADIRLWDTTVRPRSRHADAVTSRG